MMQCFIMEIHVEDIDIPVEDGRITLKGSIYFLENITTRAPWIINFAGLMDHRESYFVKYYTEKFANNGYYVLDISKMDLVSKNESMDNKV